MEQTNIKCVLTEQILQFICFLSLNRQVHLFPSLHDVALTEQFRTKQITFTVLLDACNMCSLVKELAQGTDLHIYGMPIFKNISPAASGLNEATHRSVGDTALCVLIFILVVPCKSCADITFPMAPAAQTFCV